MNLELEGRVAVVTGASVGIGRGVAKALAAEGVRLVLIARRKELLESLAAEIGGTSKPLLLARDVTASDTPDETKRQVLKTFGRLDILVNNAGGSRPTDLDAYERAWQESLALNFEAARRLTHALLPLMQERRWGRIVNVTGSLEAKRLNAAAPAKAAMHAWAKGLSSVVGPFGITVNSIVPGRIHSEQIDQRLHPTAEDQKQFASANIPLGYFGDPEDIATLVTFLSSPRARYITGEIIHVDGGLRHHAF
ncbi:MAG: 3-oxoacyl-ACP reductase [Candidatus Rokuibacteriota bacterium]|nr:MAG: 3-oxoacyl-ACP reductase [Candidatus Rokubacteria bacterium]